MYVLSRYSEALENYKKALKVLNRDIPHARPLVEFNELKADIYLEIGKTYKRLSEFGKAEKNFRKSSAVCKQGLQFASDNSDILTATGLSLRNLGDLKSEMYKHDEAAQHFTEAIEYLNRALEINPDSEAVRYNKAYALLSLGEALEWNLGSEAIEVLTEAAELFKQITLNNPQKHRSSRCSRQYFV